MDWCDTPRNSTDSPCISAARSAKVGRPANCYNNRVTNKPVNERTVAVYTAGSESEALVVRGLLESSGIRVPGPVGPDPFPLADANMSRGTTHGVEVYAYESEASEARRIINGYLLRAAQRPQSDSES
jgi:hypothetical protein